MSKFTVTATVTVNAHGAGDARDQAAGAIRQGVEYGYILAGAVGEATEVDEITISKAELAAHISQCVEEALAAERAKVTA